MTDPHLFKQGMRRLASGVSIITTRDEGTPYGFLATAVSSVSAEPNPTLLICVNRNVSCHEVIRTTGVFCVNVLGSTETEIARLFSSPADRHRRFSAANWTPLATGAPALAGALASFDCKVLQEVSVQTHTIFIGTVTSVKLWDEDIDPLLYFDGHFETFQPSTMALA